MSLVDSLVIRLWAMTDTTGVDLDLFHYDEGRDNFENHGKANGGRYWSARELMAMLGYTSFRSFQQAINRAIGTCTTLGIPVTENFIQTETVTEGAREPDYNLTRFACFLTVMNGDVQRPRVAQAQAYFVTMADAFRTYVQNAENVERVQMRDGISERERSLSDVASSAGVQNYAFFQSSGYRGMYNRSLAELKAVKGLEIDKCLLDFMGKRELAANLFRINETEAKIRNERTRGQLGLENAAFSVGRRVRNVMIQTDNTRPEDLPIAQDIKLVRAGLKKTHKQFEKLDSPRKAIAPPKK